MDEKMKLRLKTVRAKIRKNLLTKLGTMDRMFDVSKVQEEVNTQLIAERRAIVLKLLGIETCHDGTIYMDSSGGIRRFMETHCKSAVQNWMMTEILPLLETRSAELLVDPALQKEVLTEFDRELRRSLMRQASEAADIAAKNAIDGWTADIKNFLTSSDADETDVPDHV